MAAEYDGPAGMTGMSETSEFEQALRTLALSASRMNRDRLMFLAGRASAQAGVPSKGRAPRFRWAWPAATVVSVCCSVVLGALLLVRGGGAAVPGPELAGPADEQNGAATTSHHDAPEPRTPQPAGGEAVVDQHRVEPVPAVPPPPGAQRTTIGAFAFGSRTDDPSRLPPYLRMRQLVLEKGLDALSPAASPDRSRESMADARLAPAGLAPLRTLRALDRPGYGETRADEWFDGVFPAPFPAPHESPL